jgi:hypothetical protein
MGNSATSPVDEAGGHSHDYNDDYAEQFDGIETLGYRVLGVQPNSPGKNYKMLALSWGAF